MRSPDPLGTPRTHLRRTDSTNERARELALAGAPHGTLVTAREQTAGRGRQGRQWWAPAGSSLLMSLILRRWHSPLPLAAAVAVCDIAGASALVKWPNDIVFVDAPEKHPRSGASPESGASPAATGQAAAKPAAPRSQPPFAKVAGILVEGRLAEQWLVLGIGLNVAVDLDELPSDLRGTVATLARPRADIDRTLDSLLEALATRLAQPSETILAQWRARDALLGRHISWNGGHGRALGVDEEGRLLVEDAAGHQIALNSGEVHLTVSGVDPARTA